MKGAAPAASIRPRRAPNRPTGDIPLPETRLLAKSIGITLDFKNPDRRPVRALKPGYSTVSFCFLLYSAFESVSGVPTVMSEDNEKYGVFIDLIKQMIGKPLKIGSTQSARVKMVSSWVPFDGG